eukprot:13104695-Ditylum_brightwellii.AAC.1
MFVGYAIQHEGDFYEMLDLRTSIVYENQDVIWLQMIYCPKPINASYTNDDDLMQWLEHMDPEVSQPIDEETKAEEADANEEEDEVVDATKGENDPKSEIPAPTTTQPDYVTTLP